MAKAYKINGDDFNNIENIIHAEYREKDFYCKIEKEIFILTEEVTKSELKEYPSEIRPIIKKMKKDVKKVVFFSVEPSKEKNISIFVFYQSRFSSEWEFKSKVVPKGINNLNNGMGNILIIGGLFTGGLSTLIGVTVKTVVYGPSILKLVKASSKINKLIK